MAAGGASGQDAAGALLQRFEQTVAVLQEHLGAARPEVLARLHACEAMLAQAFGGQLWSVSLPASITSLLAYEVGAPPGWHWQPEMVKPPGSGMVTGVFFLERDEVPAAAEALPVFFVCEHCGSLVDDGRRKIHERWHSQ